MYKAFLPPVSVPCFSFIGLFSDKEKQSFITWDPDVQEGAGHVPQGDGRRNPGPAPLHTAPNAGHPPGLADRGVRGVQATPGNVLPVGGLH